jgi:predicted glycogen debranching enzyme
MQELVPVMTPAPGARLQRHVGDVVRFVLKDREGRAPVGNWTAKLRTNLGRAKLLRREIIEAHTKGLAVAGASWRDLPMNRDADGWSLDLPLAETGYFSAKAFLMDSREWQIWPEGPDVGISVHPGACRSGNTVYCAFTRLFGTTRTAASTRNETVETQVKQIEDHGYSILPPSGKLRDLIQCLPHIVGTLGCRILHLLPVNPTPTTYARFGRFGSPYAALDLTGIDPALVVFDKRTTGVDQFRELTYATHLHGGRLFLDIVINHTGWGSTLQERRPEWFLKNPDGQFASPGAWGVTWEDLVELKHENVSLWDELAEMFLIWCRRGVDGFRCDAGYKVPGHAWQYIVARVQQEYPDTIFLLEGLGGAWETTEALLTEGGMQWAYSELFQNYSGPEVARYLDHSLKQSTRVGLLLNYSETHDNDRLAKKGRTWSLLRNRLCALASVSGGFGFSCGVEWLATEKIMVHGSTGLAWNNSINLVPELAQLNQLLAEHPCFFDGAKLTRLSPVESPVYALLRESAEGKDTVLVLVNNDVERAQPFVLPGSSPSAAGPWSFDLLGQALPERPAASAGTLSFTLPPGSAYCLSPAATPRGLSGEAYRRARAQAAWAVQILGESLPGQALAGPNWRALAERVDRSPLEFLAAVRPLTSSVVSFDFTAALDKFSPENTFPGVVRWNVSDARRITPVPPGHWLLIESEAPFRASLQFENGGFPKNVESVAVRDGHIACFASPQPVKTPAARPIDAKLRVERYAEKDRQVEAAIRFLAPLPERLQTTGPSPQPDELVLLTNGIGGMARMCVDLGRVKSKYDCVLGANLHPEVPVDRHVFVKRLRVWANANGFISPLDQKNLTSFDAGPPAVWRFTANAGDGRKVEIELRVDMIEGRNTTVLHFRRPGRDPSGSNQSSSGVDLRLTVRPDIEDRNFHSETRRNGGAEYHFSTNTKSLAEKAGFVFAPAADRRLRVFVADEVNFPPTGATRVRGKSEVAGAYHPQPEWCENIPHPVEQNRGQTGSGDAYSPGWFELILPEEGIITLVITADVSDPDRAQLESSRARVQTPQARSTFPEADAFGQQLVRAAHAFVVRRGTGQTVIAGYPWFLDWGRDTLICARGLLAAGMTREVKQILLTFARFEKDGTLPNSIHGEDASNRDTTDAPLWFGVVCEEIAALERGEKPARTTWYDEVVDTNGRTIRDVLWDIAIHYAQRTPNGISMDADSALIWSPSHFTWMDTNYPAGTPRKGYPVEIQALWIRLLRQLERIGGRTERQGWDNLAAKALASFEKYFWLEDRGYYADSLIARSGQSAAQAVASDALRSNCLFPISLGLAQGERARRCVEAARRYLVVPGALRSLAPLPVKVPLPVQGNDGRLLNDPVNPYWGRYEGDEDTRRKPAYHNGTAWTWTFPVFCEALARAWDLAPEAVAAARAYLGSTDQLLNAGCLGQIPEIVDGDAPHAQRGCDAQAWGVTEVLRVWKLLER